MNWITSPLTLNVGIDPKAEPTVGSVSVIGASMIGAWRICSIAGFIWFFLSCIRRCLLRPLLSLNFFGHMLHWYGLVPIPCVRIWTVRLPRSANALLHTEQECGFMPECISLWPEIQHFFFSFEVNIGKLVKIEFQTTFQRKGSLVGKWLKVFKKKTNLADGQFAWMKYYRCHIWIVFPRYVRTHGSLEFAGSWTFFCKNCIRIFSRMNAIWNGRRYHH